MKPVISIIALSAFLSGCASIVNGTTQEVSVATLPVTGASCDLTNDHGAFHLAATPGTVKVHRSGNPLMVDCHKDGFTVAHSQIEPSFNGMIFGNAIAGGLVGAAVDVSTGADHSYPDSIVLHMDAVE